MKILSLDGGGVFGKAQAKILNDAQCWDKWGCFVGTSIGSVIASAAALGLQDKVSPSFFDGWMPKVFDRSWFRKFNPFVSKYPDDGLCKALQTVFGTALMGDAKRPLFVTAADIGRKTLKVFSSVDFDDARMPMWEVARSATAAETYFDVWKGLADGGVYANNPSMVAIAAVARVLGVRVEDMEVMSLGTGKSLDSGDVVPRGILQWAEWLIPAMLNGAANDMHDYFVRSLPLRNYFRVQFIRDSGWSLDSVEAMDDAMTKWAPEIVAATNMVKRF